MARESGLALLVIFGLAISLVAEIMGLHFVVGAYFAGLLLNELVGEEKLARSLDVFSGVTFGIFSPLLFAYIGVQLNIPAIYAIGSAVFVLLLVAIWGKLIGGYAGARAGGFSAADSRLIASLLNSRGMVQLVIASVVYQTGLIDLNFFSAVVGVGVITTIMSASMSRIALGSRHPE